MDLDTFLSMPPCWPIRIEDGKHVYSIEQINTFGCPDIWNPPLLCDWFVVSTNDDERPLKTDYSFDKDRIGNCRQIHRYDRTKRFESILYQLIGHRGNVDLKDLIYIRNQGVDPNPNYIWNSIREILKRGKLQKYYNRIPSIIQMLGIKLKIDVGKGSDLVYEIVRDFSQMQELFISTKPPDRKYFPNLRFIALRMLETYGATFEFNITRVRTRRKLKPLDDLWVNLFNSFQNKK
jgi:hypothetical protein